jgi:hypothetical protein
LIYDLKINKAFSLNETCAMVWAECDGEKSIAEIASTLSRRTKGLVNEEVVWLALETLQKQDLLTSKDQVQANFNGLSRRQIIKRVGLASMIAFPAIASVTAPTALMAQSGLRPLFAACSTDSQCASGNCFASFNLGLACCAMTTTTFGFIAPNSYCGVSCGFGCCSGNDSVFTTGNPCPVGQIRCMCI